MQKPEYDIFIIDGEPEQMVNAAMVRELAKSCPIGEEAGKANLRKVMGDSYYLVWPEERPTA